ncbi:MAG: hypothetical protein M3Q65_16365 [Chloroflexota bacterium]|nr:hypothetical protein [Chloroflexota bacterium]
MSFSPLEGRYNDSVYVDLTEVLDPEENVWTVAVIDMMRVGEVADGLYMAAVFAPGRLIHRAVPCWTLEEARAHASQFFEEIVSGRFIPIPYEVKPLVPRIAPEDEDRDEDDGTDGAGA